MERWSFGTENDELIELVLSGKKTATTSNYNPDDIPVVGEHSIITYSNGKDACIVETIDYKILKFKDINEKLSKLEGEGPYELWRQKHIDFFKQHDNNFNDDTVVVFETFKIIKDLKNNKTKRI